MKPLNLPPSTVKQSLCGNRSFVAIIGFNAFRFIFGIKATFNINSLQNRKQYNHLIHSPFYVRNERSNYAERDREEKKPKSVRARTQRFTVLWKLFRILKSLDETLYWMDWQLALSLPATVSVNLLFLIAIQGVSVIEKALTFQVNRS